MLYSMVNEIFKNKIYLKLYYVRMSFVFYIHMKTLNITVKKNNSFLEPVFPGLKNMRLICF